jgi:hypothetical protein
MKVQDEVVTLRQVLGAKLTRESEIKSLLGVGFVDDLKQDWKETVHDIKSTAAYQKTAETFQAASDKISPTLQTVNTSIKSRLGTLRSNLIHSFIFYRFSFLLFSDSTYFKSFGNTLGSTVNIVKSKMTPSKSAMHFNANDKNGTSQGATGGSMTTSVTHDERLNFGSSSDEKKDLSNK